MYSGVREDVAFIGRVLRGIGYLELIVNVPSSLRSSMVLRIKCSRIDEISKPPCPRRLTCFSPKLGVPSSRPLVAICLKAMETFTHVSFLYVQGPNCSSGVQCTHRTVQWCKLYHTVVT